MDEKRKGLEKKNWANELSPLFLLLDLQFSKQRVKMLKLQEFWL